MSLHNGLDTVAIISTGVYTETYNSSAPGNIANLYASLGYFEDAPNVLVKIVNIMMYYLKRREL